MLAARRIHPPLTGDFLRGIMITRLRGGRVARAVSERRGGLVHCSQGATCFKLQERQSGSHGNLVEKWRSEVWGIQDLAPSFSAPRLTAAAAEGLFSSGNSGIPLLFSIALPYSTFYFSGLKDPEDRGIDFYFRE